MFRRTLLACILSAFAAPLAIAADAPSAPPKLSAAQIVDENVAARGGLPAWRAVQTLSMTGKMDAGGNGRPTPAPSPAPGKRRALNSSPQRPKEQVQLPFKLDLKRPRKARLELQFNGQTAVQVFDGKNGWKLRPFLNRHQVEPFTPEELKAASLQSDLDGPLVDYVAKGTKVELEGTDKVEGHDTYKLKLTLKDGQVRRLWVDAKTFLETKIDGAPRSLDGTYHPVETYFREYRSVNGLMFAYVLETSVESGRQTEKIEIEKLVVNPKLDDTLFAKPQ